MEAEEERAGRGMVPEAPGRVLGWAAEEWAEAEAGRDRARAAEEREPAAPEEAVGRVRAADCGKAAPAAGRDPVGLDLVADREAGEADPEGRAEVAGGLDPAEVGERELELDRVGVAAPEAGALAADPVEEERVRVRGEAVSAEAEPVLAQVLVERVPVEEEDSVAEVVRAEEAVPAQEQELAEEELGRAERGRRENG